LDRGGGEKLTLRIVAELADGCNPASWVGTPEDFKRKIRILEEHCSSIGRDPNEIQKSWAGSILITDTENELTIRLQEYVKDRMQGLDRAKEMGFTDYNLEPSLFGTVDQCMDKIEAFINAGVTHFMFNFPENHLFEDMQLFAEKVISHYI
jgi:alkanesulfonate monooxygenase SsuD/methylene tetrahydromethanopterin reductase-like flavin-dependent oxidoreductase (luciferase family)